MIDSEPTGATGESATSGSAEEPHGRGDAGPRGPAATPRRQLITATSVAVTIVAIVVAAAASVLAFTTDDGAATPEQATTDMLDAVRHNDLIGIIEQLPPGERKALSDPAVRLAARVQTLHLVGRLDPARVPGLSFAFDDLQLRTTALSDEVHAVDVVGGRMRAEWMGGGQPLTEHARQILAREWGVTIDPVEAVYSRDFARDNLRLVTVKEGGGWHVSLAYTLAEAVRTKHGGKMPAMGGGPPAIGAATPADAVEDLVNAYANGDPERLVTLLYPDEARAVYDYAPVFLPGAREAAARAGAEGTYDVQLNKLEPVVEGSGDRRRVRIAALDMDIRDELRKQHIWYADGCFHTDQRINDGDDPFARTDSCSRDRPRPGDETAPRDNPVASLALFGGGSDLPTFTVIERNGRWFVSPVHTIADSLVDTADLLGEEDLDGFAERLADTWDAGASAGISGEPIRPTAREVAADPARAGARGKALADACAALTTGPEAADVTAACLARLVSNGKVRAEDLPPPAAASLR